MQQSGSVCGSTDTSAIGTHKISLNLIFQDDDNTIAFGNSSRYTDSIVIQLCHALRCNEQLNEMKLTSVSSETVPKVSEIGVNALIRLFSNSLNDEDDDGITQI